jgi:DNA-binding response OmpR family regulator
MAKILLIEDDLDLSDTLVRWLVGEHYTVELVHDGKEGYQRLKLCEYDVVIVDWNLPGMTGLEICQQYRNDHGTAPILMLTGKAAAAEKATGLDAGADDYLTKPFSLVELCARLRALLRRTARSGQVVSNILKLGNLTIDPRKYIVTKDGQKIHLLPREFALLEFFMRHPDEVFSVETLLQRVWHSDSNASIDAIRTCIKRLREKIDPGQENSIIQTVPRVGYRLKVD